MNIFARTGLVTKGILSRFFKTNKVKKKEKPVGHKMKAELLESRELLSGTPFSAELPYVSVDYKQISYFNGSNASISTWPTAAGSPATQFRIYGFQASAVGNEIPDAVSSGVTYPVQTDGYGNYIDLGQANKVKINIDLLNSGLPNKAVPGIALDKEVLSVATGTISGVGFQHSTDGGSSTYKSFVNVDLAVVNPGGIQEVVNDSFEVNGAPVPYDATRDSYSITGDTVQLYSTSTSGNDTLRISYGDNLQLKTTTTVSGTTPAVFGQPVILTAAVHAPSGFSDPTSGTVDFYEGAALLGSGTVDGTGTATLTVWNFSVKTHTIKANFAGTDHYLASNSTTSNVVVSKAGTTTYVTSSVNPSIYGQSVTFNANVVANSPSVSIPSGNVTFYDGTTSLGIGSLDGSGYANLTVTTAIATGKHNITAKYLGNTNFNISTSGAISQVVNQANSSITISSSNLSAVYGQPITFTATVSGLAPSTGTPGGPVTFYDGATLLGTVTPTNGVANYTTSSLSTAVHNITARYNTSLNFLPSNASLTQNVDKAASAITIASSVNATVYGQTITFTATAVGLSPTTATPGGNINFYDGAVLIGTKTPTGGVATFSTTALGMGNHTISAQYPASLNFLASSSNNLTIAVSQANSSVTLNASNATVTIGQNVTFNATVIPVSPATGVVGGNITFFDGTVPIGTKNLSGGKASLVLSNLTFGTHTITARYNGNATYGMSTSDPLTENILGKTTIVIPAHTPSPSVYGQSVALTANINITAPASGSATGIVGFFDNGNFLGNASVSGGSATINTSALTAGNHTIRAVYSGDSGFASSTSANVTHVVDRANLTVAVDGKTMVYGSSLPTLTATISGFQNNETLASSGVTGSPNLTTSGTSLASVGNYSIEGRLGTLAAGNYVFQTFVDGTLAIGKAVTNGGIGVYPVMPQAGEDATLTVDISAVLPGGGVPEGTVSILNGETILGTVTLIGGHGSLFLSGGLGAGSNAITVQYSGSNNHFASSTNVSLYVNSDPVAVADMYTLAENGTLTVGEGGVLTNDVDPDGDTMEVTGLSWFGATTGVGSSFTTMNGGSATIQANGTFSYAPALGFTGMDFFSYDVQDGKGGHSTGYVFISVRNGNEAIGAKNDAYRVSASSSTEVADYNGVLQNDVTGENTFANLSAVLVQGPSNGTLTLNSNGSFLYVPGETFTGYDSFVYKNVSGSLESSNATVVLTSDIFAANDSYSGSHGKYISDNVMANDILGDSSPDTVRAVIVTGPQHGNVAMGSDGKFSYRADSGFVGSDSFLYKLVDGGVESNNASVFLQLTNTAPLAGPSNFSIGQDETLNVDSPIGVLRDAYDEDGDTITTTLVSGTTNGTLTLNSNGSFSYIPNPGFSGMDQFYFRPADEFEVGGQFPAQGNLLGAPGPILVQILVQGAAAAPATFTVSGIIDYDAVIPPRVIHPVRNAVVQLLAPAVLGGMEVIASTTTSDGGAYSFDVPLGRYNLLPNSLVVKVLASSGTPNPPLGATRTIAVKNPDVILAGQNAVLALPKALILAQPLMARYGAAFIGQEVIRLVDRVVGGLNIPGLAAPIPPPAGFNPAIFIAWAKGAMPQILPDFQSAVRSGIEKGNTYSVSKGVPGGNNANVVVGIDIGMATDNERAFWTFDAGLSGVRAHEALPNVPVGTDYFIFEPLGGMVAVPTSVTPPGIGASIIRRVDFNDFDTIVHEYGHQVQQVNGFFPFTIADYAVFELTGGAEGAPAMHNGMGNIRLTVPGTPLDVVNKFAFSEGWADFFSVFAQDRDFTVPSAAKNNAVVSAGGDVSGDLLFGNADVEVNNPIIGAALNNAQNYGEDDEMAVMRILWDLTDGQGEGGKDRVQLGLRDVFLKLVGDPSASLGVLMNKLISGATAGEGNDFGAVLQLNGISVDDLTVGVNGNNFFTLNDPSIPTFSWSVPIGELNPTTHSLMDFFNIQIFNNDYSIKIYDSGLIDPIGLFNNPYVVTDNGLNPAGAPARKIKLSWSPAAGPLAGAWGGLGAGGGDYHVIIFGTKFGGGIFRSDSFDVSVV